MVVKGCLGWQALGLFYSSPLGLPAEEEDDEDEDENDDNDDDDDDDDDELVRMKCDSSSTTFGY